jgi:Zn-dependent protease
MGPVGAINQHISVHPSFILWLSLLVYFRMALVLPFLLAIGFHELGHYVLLCLLRKPPTALTLSFSGIRMQTPPLSYKEELAAAAAGPLSSFLLVLIFPASPWAALYSVCLGLFNLLPIPGLDGGRMMSALLHLLLSDGTADRISFLVGLLTASGFCMVSLIISLRYSLGLWPTILAALFLLRAIEVWRL